MNIKDHQKLLDVQDFNKYDLYSKEDNIYISEDVKKYYEKLLNEYFFEELQW